MGTVNAIEGEARELALFLRIRNNARRILGFVFNPHRINVALSRAKYAQIIIGNMFTLSNCHDFCEIINYHLQHNAVVLNYIPNEIELIDLTNYHQYLGFIRSVRLVKSLNSSNNNQDNHSSDVDSDCDSELNEKTEDSYMNDVGMNIEQDVIRLIVDIFIQIELKKVNGYKQNGQN